MKNVMKSMFIAISMYSKVPTPFIDWEEEAMQYSFCFFPLVGLIIGAMELLWWYMAHLIGVNTFFFATVATVIPLLITGGIHMDGYMDTMDAKHSWQSKERRLEILKDPHLGAFAVITAFIYMILYLGAASEIASLRACIMVSIGFIISRAYSSMAFVWFQPAKQEGTFYQFAKSANKKAIAVTQCIILFICTITNILINPFVGSVIFLSTLLTFLYYKRMANKFFGGVTGDLAGYFLQICELIIIMLVVLGFKIVT
ncbi:MAG: adenosylcobinamide-GDP ribazoletransferase [bacterium]|nr:adenosylcobinamide-GDP ribazoletransferase [bacterium]